jgi:GcrA cell cycle regulator
MRTPTVVPLKPRADKAPKAPKRLTLFELTERTCKWPFGERPPFTFCGHETIAGSSYCDFHDGIAYVVPPPRRLRAA